MAKPYRRGDTSARSFVNLGLRPGPGDVLPQLGSDG